MTPERWQQIEHAFHQALSLPPAERRSFLTRVCGDDRELRNEVERMLESEEDSAFMKGPLAGNADLGFAEDSEDELIGKQLSHYQVLERIGAGGMGEVFRAKDLRLSRDVALKILPVQYTRDQDRLRRFKIEAMAAARLNHPNIVIVYEIEEAEGIHFIATEYIHGVTLREYLKQRKPSLKEAMEVAIQAIQAIEAAHAEGIVHRDIKPENIMRRQDGQVKMLDFGLAKLAEAQLPALAHFVDAKNDNPSINLTLKGALMGTPRYMSPEQVRGQSVDARADIFSLGCVLYEMLAGQSPFQGETTEKLFEAILHQQPAPLSRFVSRPPVKLERIAQKALAKSPEDRYQTASQMRDDLQALRQSLERDKLRSSNLIWWGATVACVLVALFFVRNWLGQSAVWPIDPDQDRTMLVDKSIRSGAGILRASISPDGKWLAYGISNEGETIIFVHQMNGPAEWTMTDGKWRDRDPIWSTDGRRLLFLSNREGRPGIWSAPFTGQQPSSVAPPKPELIRELNTAETAPVMDEGLLVASDDNDRLIYVEQKFNLYALTLASGQFIRLTNFDWPHRRRRDLSFPRKKIRSLILPLIRGMARGKSL